jgi:hypothetical protein
LAGNSNASNTTSKLGTTNGIHLRLYTNNVERVRILSSNGYMGIGTLTPTERLHVNGASGANALRVQVAGNTKLLVHKSGGVSIGANIIPPTNGLFVNGKVGLGTTAPTAKLHIVGTSPSTTALQLTSGGIRVNNDWNTGDTFIGIYGEGGTGVFGSGMTGVEGDGMTGVYGTGYSGVTGQNWDGSSGYGVSGYSTEGIGIYGNSSGSYAGYFEGNVYSTGTYLGSDRTLKQDITDVTSAMTLIGKLQPKSYTYRHDGNYKLMNLPAGTHYGLIAQDVEQVFPDLVKATTFNTRAAKAPVKSSSGTLLATGTQASETIAFKALNYTELIPIVIKGMQEQEERMQKQEAIIESLLLRIKDLESTLSKVTGSPIGASVTNTSTLGQNTPNPARATTRISYQVPAGSSRAQLQVYDAGGKLVKAVSLQTSGIVTLNTATLSSGMYTYTLLVDGKVTETKKMTVTR